MGRKTSSKPAPPLSETNWQARADANTLREAGMIKGDPKRLGNAQKVAREEAAAFRKVAGRSKSK